MTDTPNKTSPSFFSNLFGYVKSRWFLITLGGLAVGGLLILLLTDWGLKWYTNHGQRLEVGDYIGMKVKDASNQIERQDFRVELIDSVYLVDKPPHVVLRQDPTPGSFVKENRRIYLTVTKAIPDEVELPPLTGTYDYDRYLRKLKMLDINGSVRQQVYSNRYQANTILNVYYQGEEISEERLKSGFSVPRGSALEFTVSSKRGGLANVPNVVCLTLEEASFFIKDYRLRVGRIDTDATVTDPQLAYVWRQDPPYTSGAQLPFDTEVHLFVTQKQPEDCNGQSGE